MAKRPSAKTKRAKAQRAKPGEGYKVMEEIGQLTKDGTVNIDLKKLEQLKATLANKPWRKVRFVALNAPFARRSPIPPD
jgi:hypothetical protein